MRSRVARYLLLLALANIAGALVAAAMPQHAYAPTALVDTAAVSTWYWAVRPAMARRAARKAARARGRAKLEEMLARIPLLCARDGVSGTEWFPLGEAGGYVPAWLPAGPPPGDQGADGTARQDDLDEADGGADRRPLLATITARGAVADGDRWRAAMLDRPCRCLVCCTCPYPGSPW